MFIQVTLNRIMLPFQDNVVCNQDQYYRRHGCFVFRLKESSFQYCLANFLLIVGPFLSFCFQKHTKSSVL